ncbi:MAG: hypothetical protein JJ908_08550 [Rhizobiales bacterium]|nr:hypothetical protein [Hyphomicrobiales bacterium]MBO6697340.1 hypothetical protein [Hyphomicrobiales bacterium]MBO6736405.1 hypothetical protein [Hyphomicrobiales bacterium]MBO6912875.1 hypothetical protein [Hyphomicrobiales bacterium]MBO6954043.1 hypothetical protein [Hyphomicrobiales bacterium]
MQAPYLSPPGRMPKPPLVRFLIKNAAIGFATAVLFVAAMLYFNVGNLMALIVQSDVGLFAIVLMTLMIGFTFASLQMGFAVMFASDDIDKGQPGRASPLMSNKEMRRLGLRPLPVKPKPGAKHP